MTKTMKAVGFSEFGSASVLKVMEVVRQEVGEMDVEIAVDYASVNPVDFKIREGYLQGMLPHQFPIVSGWDAAGVVSAVGSKVKDFKIGDRVAAYTRLPTVQYGSYAEYLVLPAHYVAKIPPAISERDASSVPLVSLTAFQALTEYRPVVKGSKVLVLNASGGVGGYAVQFAKLSGASVTATTGKGNIDYVKTLGVDHVVDYNASNAGDLLRDLGPFDFIFDGVGGKNLEVAYDYLAASGAIVSIVDTPNPNRLKSSSQFATFHFVHPSGEQLSNIFRQMADGHLILPAIEELPITNAQEAHLRSESHRIRGKLTLKVKF
jgi:NADPH:quinone reductase-like Zn-dependent oxidoreductase